jgi:hemerythrin
MPLLTWSDSLSVGVQDIDVQHKRLVELINQLHDAMGQGKGRAVLGKTLDGLIDYTRTHFAMEERLMATQAYPGAVRHKAEHDALTKQVLDLQSKFLIGQATVTLEVMKFLKDWLSNHILTLDKQFGAYLNSKGVK